MTTIGGRVQSSHMQSAVWLTPLNLLTALGRFDLDPCAAPHPRPWATADRHITLPEDGLAVTWSGRVWLNPPYGREARVWLAKLAEHGNGIAITFARTDTRWFRETVWLRATAALFMFGRVTFHYGDGRPAADNGGAPSVLVAYGAANATALVQSGIPGTIVNLRQDADG